MSENNEWKNNKIEGQIKGTTNIKILKRKELISFSMNTNTIKYALNSPYSFVLFLVDVKKIKYIIYHYKNILLGITN